MSSLSSAASGVPWTMRLGAALWLQFCALGYPVPLPTLLFCFIVLVMTSSFNEFLCFFGSDWECPYDGLLGTK